MSTQAPKGSAKPSRIRRSSIRYYEISDEFSHRMAQVIDLLRNHNLSVGWFDGKLPIKMHNLYFSIQDGEWKRGTPPTIWNDIATLMRTLDPNFAWAPSFHERKENLLEDKINLLLGHIIQLETTVNKLASTETNHSKDVSLCTFRMVRAEYSRMGNFTLAPYRIRILSAEFSVDAPQLRDRVKSMMQEKYPNTSWMFDDETTLPSIYWESSEEIELKL